MKGLVLTHVGIEDVSAKEIQSLIKASEVETSPGRVLFSFKKEEDLATLCYFGRTFSKVVLILEEREIKNEIPLDILKNKEALIDKTAVVNCERSGNHPFTSFDVQSSLNSELVKIYNVKVDHKSPQTTFFILIDNKSCFFGIDFSGFDLGKRDYRIFLGANSLKGTIAASLLDIAGFLPKHTLLDPFCRHGVIPIEAALLSTNSSPHKFCKDKFAFSKLPNKKFEVKDNEKEFSGTIIAMDENFKHVSSSKKNAKIASVIKSINFSRKDLRWLDAKFGKNFLDRIITFPTQLSRNVSEKKAEKCYHELFYQAEFILKKSGKICLCMRSGIDILKSKAEEFDFVLEHERKIMQGKEEFTVLLFSKSP